MPATPMILAQVDKSKKDAVGEDKTRINPKDGGGFEKHGDGIRETPRFAGGHQRKRLEGIW